MIVVEFFSSKISTKIVPKKMGKFSLFQLIKNYAETTLLIDETYTSQKASYTDQQNSRTVKSPKI